MPKDYDTYLVIGIYEDNNQRFAEDFQARSPEEAEKMCLREYPGLIIAGVCKARVREFEVVAFIEVVA